MVPNFLWKAEVGVCKACGLLLACFEGIQNETYQSWDACTFLGIMELAILNPWFLQGYQKDSFNLPIRSATKLFTAFPGGPIGSYRFLPYLHLGGSRQHKSSICFSHPPQYSVAQRSLCHHVLSSWKAVAKGSNDCGRRSLVPKEWNSQHEARELKLELIGVKLGMTKPHG